MCKEKAIEKLRKEILSKEITIKSIERFEELSVFEQLNVIKDSDLRYNREFREKWVGDILNYKGYQNIDSNSNKIIVTYKNHKLLIPTYNYDGVIVEEIPKIKEPIVPSDKLMKLMKERKMASEEYYKNPSFKNFKAILNLGSTEARPVMWWINRSGALDVVNSINSKSINYILENENAWDEYSKVLKDNYRIRDERSIFENDMKDDFKMFENSGLKVYKKY